MGAGGCNHDDVNHSDLTIDLAPQKIPETERYGGFPLPIAEQDRDHTSW